MPNLLRLFEQRLVEANDYEDMFAPMEKILLNMNSEVASLYIVANHIDMAKKYVAPQRKDKQMWCSRILRAYAAGGFAGLLSRHKAAREEAAMVQHLYEKYVEQTGPLFRVKNITGSNSGHFQAIYDFIEAMRHYDGVNYGKIKNFSYNSRMTEEQVFDTFRELEEDYIERAKGMIPMAPTDEVLVKMPPYYWIKLDRASCPLEAKAMGHCGNSPRQGTSDRIVSLRLLKDTIEGVQYFEPCLTFILHADGYLGEMKGKGNLKPAEHYHDQIEALLHLPIIKGIRGGGYLPQNNFALKDFGPERAAKSMEAKPELMPLRDQYEALGFTPRFEKALVDGYLASGKDFWVQSNFNPDMLNGEDKAKLYRDNPIMMPPREYYEAHGMDDHFEKLLGQAFDRTEKSDHDISRFKQVEQFNLDMLTDGERKKLFTDYPNVMNALQYYGQHGLDDKLMGEIVAGIEGDSSSHNYYQPNAGQRWWDRHRTYTEGFKPESLSEADRHRLWRTHPATATLADRYAMDGLTDDFLDELENGYEQKGLEFFQANEFEISDMSEEDQTKVFDRDPVLAPAKVSLAKMGAGEAWGKIAEKKLEVGNVDGINFYTANWRNDESLMEMEEFGSVRALIEEHGDDTLKRYGENQYDYYSHESVDESHYAVENFNDELPIEVQAKLYEKARSLVDEDEDDIESWSDVVRVLKDNDDPYYEAIISAVEQGERDGVENEVHKALLTTIENIKLTHGRIKFTMWKNAEGEHIDFEEPCQWVMTAEETADFLDGTAFVEAANGNLSDVLPDDKIEMQEPYYGFSGYDSESAVDRFMEDSDLSYRDFEPNPYPEAKRAKMSAKQLLAAIEETYDKCGDISVFRPRNLESLDADKLREKLAYIVARYYLRDGEPTKT